MAEDDPLPTLLVQLRDTFGLDAVSVLRPEDDGWVIEAAAGPARRPRPTEGSDLIELGDGASWCCAATACRPSPAGCSPRSRRTWRSAVRARDLSEEAAEAAELVEVDELRTAILQAVSHDLRTPLASIKAAASSLRQDDVPWSEEETEEFLATIEEETDRLSVMVGNLLDMSRIQSGALNLVRVRVGLDEVVPRALASLPDNGRAIRSDVPESLPRVDVDAALLGARDREHRRQRGGMDARRGTRRDRRQLGGATASSSGSSTAGRGSLRTTATGCSNRSNASAIVRPADGVGLGLAVAKGFVEAMGGELTIEDTPGGGLTMVMSFSEAA